MIVRALLFVSLCATSALASVPAGPAPGPQAIAPVVEAPAPRPAPRILTLADRIRAQEAIERVYYRHQIGATKPFEAAVTKDIIEAKVRRYLEESIALETLWKTPITDAALERELERMAGGSRMPERLREIYAALGNDAFLIKECVARATLVARLAHNFYAYDARFHAASRRAIDSIQEQLASGALKPQNEHPSRTVSDIAVSADGVSQDELDKRRSQFAAVNQASAVVESRDAFSFDVLLSETPTSLRIATYVATKTRWEAWWPGARTAYRAESVTPVASTALGLPAPANGAVFDPNAPCTGDGWNNGVLDDLPEARAGHSAVWTGSMMLVWGGLGLSGGPVNSGARYDPVTDTWQPMTTTNAPRSRFGHTAVWSGTEMIVWGGEDYSSAWFVSGGRYDPIADRWTKTSLGPSARRRHTAVWTGTRMIIWGGYFAPSSGSFPTYLNTGALYDPATDTWAPTAVDNTFGRSHHTAVWTGTEMIVWGGSTAINNGFPTGDGRRYNPVADSWSPIAYTDARTEHSAVWTGTSMLVWGGLQLVPCTGCPGGLQFLRVNTGVRYDPNRDLWIEMSVDGAPLPMRTPLATWTGHSLIVIENGENSSGSGGRYDPSTDHWVSLPSNNSPLPRVGASLVWTGRYAIVWGGAASRGPGVSLPANSGRRYDPWSDTWTPTSTSGPASQRASHSAVWTGNEMIVWGGSSIAGLGVLASGGRYDPGTDSWTETSTQSAPAARRSHTSVWTGGEMLVWGGVGAAGNLRSGGRYSPLGDTWSAMTEVDAPSPRLDHAAVWTGQRMVVWGGRNAPAFLGDGGVYDPAMDTWKATSLVGAPSPRRNHTATWTGRDIVVWGGYVGSSFEVTNTGARFDPESDSWTPTSLDGAPNPRAEHSAVWAGSRVVVWGGRFSVANTGGRYDPVTDTWAPTTTAGAPPGRYQHAAVTTGNRMLVWGGNPEFGRPAGGIYDAVADRWTKYKPWGERFPEIGTAVWTGEAMLIWTGDAGGRYSPGSSFESDCDGDGMAASTGDCDDHDATTYPAAPELCDGVANDCGSFAWPGFTAPPWESETDLDRDGWMACAGDCDDNNIYIHPGQPDVCDGWDTDCSGEDPAPTESDEDNDGYRICQGDCNDANFYVRPGAGEYCNGFDDDCDSQVDEGGDAHCVFNRGCLTGTCSGSQGCTNLTDVVGPCDDGKVCTVNDACFDGDCVGSTLPNGTPCDDNRPCTINDRCSSGLCFSNTFDTCGRDDNDCNGLEYCEESTGECTTLNVLADCDDNNVCTDDSCDDETGCQHVFNSAPCDDGNACTTGDTCSAGLCLAGAATTCDDGNPCTDDACAPWEGCTYANHEGACDDGNACTGWDTCANGTCVGNDPVVCPEADACHVQGTCDPATGTCSGGARPDGTVCDDGQLCTTGDRCVAGSCAPIGSGLVEPNPRTNGYYKSLCQGPHSGDQLTDPDAACVGEISRTFAGIATVAELCAELMPSHPNGDPCDRTEDDLMVLALNLCRGRTCTSQPIASQCGGNVTVGASFEESDAALSLPSRSSDTCAHAKCLLEEINTGRALELNSLTVRRETGGVRLTWAAPYINGAAVRPTQYQVWRRVRGSLAPFARVATTVDPTFLDVSTAGEFEYDVTALKDQ